MFYLFSWVSSFFFRPRLDVYRPKERMIFHYWNGEKMVCADPIAIYKRIMAVGPEISIDIKISTSLSKDAPRAQDSLVKSIRGVFSLKPLLDGIDCSGTLSDIESLKLMDQFTLYCDSLKKNLNIFPTSPTATSEPSEYSLDASQPMPNSLDSGSTATEPLSEGPTPSPSAPGSP